MTDTQDSNDEVCSMSQRLQSITTADTNINQNENSSKDRIMPKTKNNQSTNASQDRKKCNMLCTVDDSWMYNDLPKANLPERIIFIIDTARESDCTQFETRIGGKYSPLSMIKRVIEIFVNVKLGIQNTHEFSIMTLNADHVAWRTDFTNDRKVFLSYLEKIEEDILKDDKNSFDLGPCFEKMFRNIDLERINGIATHVNRVILIYARSHSIPQLTNGRQYFDILSEDSYFFVDSLYVHEPVSEHNMCQEIYNQLAALDVKQTSFILETGRNPANLHTNMAKLIAHPLQRAKQDNSSYSLFDNPGSPQEVQTNV